MGVGHGRKVSHIPVCEKWNDGDEHEGRVSAVEANLTRVTVARD